MVERLKQAIAKAREQREGAPSDPAPAPAAAAPAPAPAAPALWDALPELVLDDAHLQAQRIVTYRKTHTAHVIFDVLRTRLVRACRDNGWTRVGVTSPTKGCGKSLICANLAFSIARHQDCRALLIDLDLRVPHLADLVGDRRAHRIGPFLAGEAPVEAAFQRVDRNLAVALNRHRERDPSETMQSARTAESLTAALGLLKPDLVLFDLPPLLAVDDAIGFLPNLDAVLLVAAAGQTRAHEISECERLLADGPALLGVVLNKERQTADDLYAYDYLRD